MISTMNTSIPGPNMVHHKYLIMER